MSTKFESPTRYMSDFSDNESVASTNSAPYTKTTPTSNLNNNTSIHQEFLNVIQARQQDHQLQNASTGWSKNNIPTFYRHQRIEDLAPIESNLLNNLMQDNTQYHLLIIDVRSFLYFSKSRIKSAVNVSIPSVLLKRPAYNIEKVCESVTYDDKAAERLKKWNNAAHIVFYDHSSHQPSDSGNSATAILLGSKLRKYGYKGHLNYLQGGLKEFSNHFPNQCEMSPIGDEENSRKKINRPTSIQLPLPTNNNVGNNGQAMNPFFTNIRQNLELSHGPLKERFAVRLPWGLRYSDGTVSSVTSSPLSSSLNSTHHPRFGLAGSSVDHQGNLQLPIWLRDIMDVENGPKKLAEMYEKLERIEQNRLLTIMKYHSKDETNEDEAKREDYFPFSITSSMEKGSLNRYDNIWPYAYSRVKLSDKNDDYINANYIQYATIKKDITLSPISQSEEEIKLQEKGLLSQASLRTMNRVNVDLNCNRQYISTQGPLPTTFNDFWKLIWDERSFVIVMLTQEMEMNKIKCHKYWPSLINAPQTYGTLNITLLSESKQSVLNMNDKRERDEADDEYIIIRKISLKHKNEERVITQLQYTGWTDFGVPDQPVGILQLVYRADEAARYYQYRNKDIGPMIVHCSAGCGRSGTFCVIDTIIQRLWHEQDVYTSGTTDKIRETVNRFREQRMSMVQTHRQFVFCYEAILWWLLGYGYLPASSSPLPPVHNSFLPKATPTTNVIPSAPSSLFSSFPLRSENIVKSLPCEDEEKNFSIGSIVDDFREL